MMEDVSPQSKRKATISHISSGNVDNGHVDNMEEMSPWFKKKAAKFCVDKGNMSKKEQKHCVL